MTMTEKALFRGTGVAMVTPFLQDGEIDYNSLANHTGRLIDQGTSYLVVLGTTAETPTLSAEDKENVIRCVTDACGGRIPVMLGIGGNDTRAVVAAVKKADPRRIQGILSVSPYYNKPGQEGIYQHFAAIASLTELPVMLYNVPGRTGSNIAAETVLRLASDFEGTIVGVKEASGNQEQVMEIIRQRPAGFLVVSGDDAIILPIIADKLSESDSSSIPVIAIYFGNNKMHTMSPIKTHEAPFTRNLSLSNSCPRSKDLKYFKYKL